MEKGFKKIFHEILAIALVLATIAETFYYSPQPVQAAAYTFFQTDWSAGASGSNASHPGNQIGWSRYNSASSSVNTLVSGEVSLNYSTSSVMQTTDTDFNAGIFSSTAVSGSGSGASVILASSSVFTAVNNPSTINDEIYAVAADSNYIYAVGYSTLTQYWRIEKRNLSNGALVTAFDGDGVVLVSTSADADIAYDIAIDSTYMYVVGIDGVSGTRWVIEKRNLSDGALVGARQYVDVGGAYDIAYNIAIDSSYMYVGGKDYSGGDRWRIEKRNLSDLSRVTAFDTDGIITEDLNIGVAFAEAIMDVAVDSSYLYAVGYYVDAAGDYRWRVEKRNKSTGALVDFAESDPSTGADQALSVAVDSTYLYVVGYDNSPGNNQWRIEKRNLSNLDLVAAFDGDGIIQYNPSTGADQALSVAVDSTYLYVVGYDNSPGNNQWRIEKRNLSNGALVTAFDDDGIIQENPSSGADRASSIVVDSNFIYIGGYDNFPGNSQWRIEKRAISNGFGGQGGYSSDGTFESSVIDTNQVSDFTTLDFGITEPASTNIQFQVAASNSAGGPWNYVGPDGASGTYFTTSGTTIPASLDNNKYVRYKAYLTTTDSNNTPSLDSITVNYQNFSTNQILTSSAYNSSNSANTISRLRWSENLPGGTDIKFQIRTAPDNVGSPGTWSQWLGLTGSGDYYTDPFGGETINALHRDNSDDQWFQYQAILDGSDSGTPTLSDVSLDYSFVETALEGSLESSIFDTQIIGGAAINSIVWQGALNGGVVEFQIASSNNSSGPWNYFGPDGSFSSYYGVGIDANNSIQINLAYHNNHRYFRYKIILQSDAGRTQSPAVEDVIINWSP